MSVAVSIDKGGRPADLYEKTRPAPEPRYRLKPEAAAWLAMSVQRYLVYPVEDHSTALLNDREFRQAIHGGAEGLMTHVNEAIDVALDHGEDESHLSWLWESLATVRERAKDVEREIFTPDELADLCREHAAQAVQRLDNLANRR